MGLAQDPEFSDSDSERLADLIFRIEKRYVDITVGDDAPKYRNADHSESAVIENENGFEWNYEGNELRFSRDNVLLFQLYDFDGGLDVDQNLGHVFVIFGDYVEERPSQVNIVEGGGSIDITIDLEWN